MSNLRMSYSVIDSLVSQYPTLFKLYVLIKQEAQLLLGDRATRKHAKDC